MGFKHLKTSMPSMLLGSWLTQNVGLTPLNMHKNELKRKA